MDTLCAARVAIDNADPRARNVPFEVMLGERRVALWACLRTTHRPAIHIVTRDARMAASGTYAPRHDAGTREAQPQNRHP